MSDCEYDESNPGWTPSNTVSANVEGAVEVILRELVPDHPRPGLDDTPSRVARMYANELLVGYQEDPAEHLTTTFDQDVDQMVMVANIPVWSLCEHHLVPIIGRAWVAYIPQGGRVVGLSKLARVVDGYARRLQLQERLTTQVAEAIEQKLNPLGTGVYIEARHLCMEMRGVQAEGTLTKTNCVRGVLMREDRARAEFFSMVGDTR